MERNPIEDLARTVRLSRRRRQDIARELQTHVEDTRRELELSGWHPESAERESLTRLGDPARIAEGFEDVYRPSRRSQLGLAVALATGLILGVYGIGGSLASATPSAKHSHTAKHAHLAPTTHRHAQR